MKKKIRLLSEYEEISFRGDSEIERKVTETRASFEGSPESEGSRVRLAAQPDIRLLDSKIDSPIKESK